LSYKDYVYPTCVITRKHKENNGLRGKLAHPEGHLFLN
jgi:hypothetical protein